MVHIYASVHRPAVSLCDTSDNMEDFSEDTLMIPFSGNELEEDNDSLTCVDKFLEASANSTLSSSVSISSRVLQVLYLILVLTSGTILNSLVVYLVSRSKKLRTRAFAVAVQIALANLIIITLFGIPLLLRLINGQTFFSIEICIVEGCIMHILVDVRILLVFLYSLDRFASVFAPFMYPRHSLKLTVLNSMLAWLVVIVSNVLGMTHILDCYTLSNDGLVCTINMTCSIRCKVFQLTYTLAVLFPAMISSLIFITAMYIKGKKFRQRDAEMMGAARNQWSNEWKALKTFLLLTLSVIVVNLSIIVLLMLTQLENYPLKTLSVKLVVNVLIFYLIIDPIVILRNADFKEELVKTLRKLQTLLKQN